MRRKSERNKSKGSPEKKVEKATRKSTRKRGKRATSSSPEREKEDVVELKSTEILSKNDDTETKELSIQSQSSTRLKIKELKTIVDDDELSVNKKLSIITEDVNTIEKIGEIGGEGGSLWKVARADASPGEIQKLKLCRQRNPSEASDSSSSRKKSHKSYESGEGDGEEGDSTDEQTRSRKFRDFGRNDRSDDPSSSNPRAQDSKEEVSHCSDVLPRNTTSSSSANFLLSDDDDHDDKQNLDRLDEKDAKATATSTNQLEKEENIIQNVKPEPSSNGDGDDITDTKVQEEAPEENFDKVKEDEEGRKEVEKEETIVMAETIVPRSEIDDKIGEVDNPVKESSSEEDGYKRQKLEPSSEVNRPEIRASSRTIRRKHRSKYRESSDSDTPESEDEIEKKIVEGSKSVEEDKGTEKIECHSPNNDKRLCLDQEGGKIEQKNDTEIEERVNNLEEEKPVDDGNANSRSAGYKPPKVNLKRSFSVRLPEADESAKKEDAEKNGETDATLQAKDNHGTADETDVKNIPRKRRWGTTVATEITPAFTVSTDSLKVLVPGAKPLSITEVRLSKDDDEDKARRKEREKRHSVGDDSGDKKIREEGVGPKNDSLKKGEIKHDNHIGAKRKISILKETPRVKSPSPPSAKATNVLLIKNLVRPFTLNQIKELLSRTGTIVENGFWIDGIKSKCFVVYSNEDQAFETRQALHGISWPVSNPKRLQVEYAIKEEMELAREMSKDQPIIRKAEPLLGSDNWQQVWAREDKQNAAAKITTVREWDLGKEDGHQVKEKEREKKDLEKKRRQRSRSPPIEPHLPPPARKFKKKEDEPPPAKLLDDLFKKTKAIPCIYWLPLTNEQIVVKEEMRRQHMAEHARRLEEMKRAERSRDPGSRRRRSPRK